ncbi:MAG: hypothetical protein K0R17_2284 [Rariglobus sp.]|jgi:ABC-type uncharacterized transport system substrate-binding protein|nr:hypothetical protein [Rariglobus sp.]
MEMSILPVKGIETAAGVRRFAQMLGILRRLGLGLLLIAATSALLLLSDLRSRIKPEVADVPPAAAPARTMRVALLQHASQSLLDQGRDGLLAGLAEQGWREGVNLDLKRYNAEADMAVGQAIAKEMVGGGYDLLLTLSTPSLQAVANANKAGQTPHVFGMVTDPYSAGVGINRNNHLDHPPYLAGFGTMQPVALAFQTAREMNPALDSVGVVWNTGEANSEVQVKLARKVCADLGITLLEGGIENASGVGESTAALVARGVDAIWVAGDTTVLTAIDSLIAAARKGRVPVFTVVPSNIKRGVLFDIGADYSEVGRIVGVLAGEVLNGRKPAGVPIENRMPENLTLNLQVPAGLKDRWVVSPSIVKRAATYIDAQGVEHTTASATVPVASPSAGPAAASSAKATPVRLPRVAIVQHNTQAVFDAGVQGFLDGLAAGGFRDGETMALRKFNPLGDTNLANAVAVEVAQGGYDLILTATTPSLQTVANANRTRRTPHLFALVADPSATGVGVSATDPLAHPSHLSGYGTRLPVISAFRIAREINPALKTVGTLWNTSEVNSEVQLRDARQICKELGITLVEVNVDSTNAVTEATAVLLGREVEAVFIPGDITVLGAVNNVLQTAQRAGIPVFSLFPSAQPKGELFNVGADYRAVGHKTGLLAAEVLHGRSIATIPVENFVPERLALNDQVRAQLRDADRWRFPASLRERAGLYVNADGKSENRDQPLAAPAVATTPRAPASGPVRHIAVAYYAPEPSWEDCYRGLVDELRTLGYEQGKNLVIRSANTQGDSSHILPILQNYDSSDAEVLVTFSTPMLQGALATIRNKPIVFTYVTDPIAAGAGKTWTDHDPRVTGVGTMVPVAEGVRVIRALFPKLKRLGTLYNAGEVNSTRVIDLLRPACRDAGIELVALSVAATGDVPQAAQALAAREVEALYLPNDNLVYQAFPVVMQVADRARLPVFNGDPAYLGKGIFASVGPGYYAAGQAGAHKLARVLAGEKPAAIPMENVSVNRIGFDRAVARKLGLTFDEALLKSLETPATSAAPATSTPPVSGLSPQVARPSTPAPLKVAFAYFSPEPGVEACMRGLLAGLREAGYVEGRNLDIRRTHAQGEVGYITTMLQNFDHSDADIIVAFSTAIIQSACTQVKNKPVVFTYCTDPIAAGVGKSWTDHTPHITGIGSFPPIEDTIDLIRRTQPGIKRLGTLYNGGEANSVSIVEKLREVCRAQNIELEEVTAAATGEVFQAAQALVARGVDAVYLPSDNTAYLAYDAIVGVLNRAALPLYIDDVEFLEQGALVAIGPGHYHAGKAAAPLIARIAAGESPATIPMANVSVQLVKFNRKVAARYGVADSLIRESESASEEPASSVTPSSVPPATVPLSVAAAPRKLTKPPAKLPARLDVIIYNETPPSEETLAGFKEAMARGPLLPGRDLDIKYHNAQGDMPTLSGITDAALTNSPALLVPLSTPSLQVALGKTSRRGTPNVVFGMVANPVAAGAGRTYEDHLPHVTGISVRAPAPHVVAILKRHYPQFKRVGTLFCPSEVNSVDLRDYFTSAAAAQGITVEAIAVNSPTEIADAALTLASSRIDAIVQISDNISSSGFSALTRAARASRKPLISMNSLMVRQGAGIAIGLDYHDVGVATADRVQRVLAGEDPATIPFEQPTRIHFTVHTANARATGLPLPDALLKEAEKVIND